MGYYEVLNWLVNRRASSDDSFFTPPEIAKRLKERGESDTGISGICLKLEYDGYVEGKMNLDLKNWMRGYRATTKAIKIRYG